MSPRMGLQRVRHDLVTENQQQIMAEELGTGLACFRKLNNKEATSGPAYFNLPGLTPSSSIPTSPYPLPMLSTHIYAHT